MFDSSHPRSAGSPDSRSTRAARPLPEVADLPQEAESEQQSDEATFKVFLKRNLRHQAPPAELLGDIRARLEKIRAQK